MSSRTTLFLTRDNEHCFFEGNEPHYENDDIDKFLGWTIVLEMDKSNIRIIANDDEDLIIAIDPGSELYELIKMMRND